MVIPYSGLAGRGRWVWCSCTISIAGVDGVFTCNFVVIIFATQIILGENRACYKIIEQKRRNPNTFFQETTTEMEIALDNYYLHEICF